ncbi:MAG: hypothetical protein K0S47_2282 [Herbinix sp.]|jgi:hypothetical protein|nr:hypothetical protein [Herbinix sp.]
MKYNFCYQAGMDRMGSVPAFCYTLIIDKINADSSVYNEIINGMLIGCMEGNT